MNLTEFNAHTNSFRDQICQMVEDMFNQEGRIDPVVFALVKMNDSEEMAVTVLDGMGPLFSNRQGKEVAAGLIREAMKELKPIAVAFASEAWCVKGDRKQAEEDESFKKMLDGETTPSEHPDKMEILFVNVETHNMENITTWTIEREGEEAKLVPQDLTDGQVSGWNEKQMSGRLADFLKESYQDIINDVELN